ncbi:MAG: hypothetical protein LAP21_27065 [Acidobacteriia bacterium]|nr:hypothetical protein [Terriglobia bacterium]
MQVQGRLFATALVVLSTLVLPLSYSQSTNSGTNPAPVNPPASNPAPDPQAAAQASQKAQKATAANSNVEQAVASANALVQTAQRYQKTISGVTSATTQRTQPAIEDLHTLQTTLIAIQQNNIPGKLTDALNQLDPKPAKGTSLESTRKAACTDLSQPAVPQQDVTDALKACAKVEADAASLKGALNAQLSLNDPDSLATALQSIYPYISNQIGSYLSKLDALSKVPAKTDTPAATLLQKLPPGLTSLREVLASQQEYQMVWNNTLKPILAQLKVSAPATDTSGKAVPAVDDQITSLTTRTGQIVANLNVWFPVLSTSLQDSATGLDALLTGVQTDPAARNAAALDKIRDGSDDLTSAQSIVDAWPPLVGFLVDGTPEGFSLRTAKQEFLKLQRATNALRISIARLSDTVGGDASGFETAQVSLYYFFDVNRLMTALNGNTRTIGGVAEAQAAAAEQRKSLAQAELDLADAQATVNRYQKQVLDLQEQQRQLREKLKGLDTSLSKLGNRLKSAQDAKGTADELVKKAQADQTANANDPAKATAVDKATAAQTTAAGKASQSQSDYDSAKADHDNVQGQLDGSQNQSDSLPAKLAAAQQALSDSQTAVSRERRRMLLAAQAESDAFAFARDNAPFLYAQADASSTDPAKRVFLYAFNDSKSIFMRGKPDDINEVKHIIAEFDKPAPQARLTLWTFQLNADANGKANKDAAQKLNDSMAMIDEELSNSRALENTTLTLLRDLVNREVRNAAAQHEKQCATNPALCKGLDGADLEKFHRLSFYDVKILSQLGINPDNPDPKKRWREVVPDPAGTTTLGEALIVLSLGRPEIRAGVRQEFESKIPGLLQNLHVKSWPPEDGTPSVMLPLTWHALGIWEPGTVDGAAGLTSQQLEITRALKTWYESRQIKAALDKLAALSSEFTLVDRRLDDIDLEVNDLKERATSKLNALDQKRLIDLQKLSKPSEPEQAEINKLVQSGINQLPASDRSNYSQKTFAQRQLNARRHNIIKAMPATQVLESHGIDVESVITDRP